MIDLNARKISVAEARISSPCTSLNKLTSFSYSTARIFGKIAGKIVSMKYIVGNIVRLKTRAIYKTTLSALFPLALF